MNDVETAHGTDPSDAGGPAATHDPVPMVIDWLIGILTGIVGLLITALGISLYSRVDRAMIADAVDAEATELEGITRADFITAAEPFLDWFAAGIAVTGLVALGAAAVFVYKRRGTRARVASKGGTTATFWACAVYGAVVTVLVSFIPGSAAAGGGAAAYLHDGASGTRLGAVSGLVGAALTVPLVVFVSIGLLAGASAIGQAGGAVVLLGILVVGTALAMALNAGLGALGGYLATRFT
jgi:hypothetical protein